MSILRSTQQDPVYVDIAHDLFPIWVHSNSAARMGTKEVRDIVEVSEETRCDIRSEIMAGELTVLSTSFHTPDHGPMFNPFDFSNWHQLSRSHQITPHAR
ncbi:hypothetical protein D584_19398 [Brucella intermedia M86]|uniref:Uncharacterized protein n=1 Tax=Brucella intermedia M86 TaxID=1234597 RepID=M5JL81_9HYPH|nr:hypothetical protein D584_19398 [Brucella intermedia M86]